MRQFSYMKHALIALVFGVSALTAAPDVRMGWYDGRQVTYEVRDGLAVYQGDIVLGTAGEMERGSPGSAVKNEKQSTVIRGARYRWPDAVIPYSIDNDLPGKERITDAITHWNERTPVRLVERTDQSNYVRFRREQGVCSSSVGMQGRGEQLIRLSDSCDLGSVIHEIGHAVGLWHEQSRQDRDFYVRVLIENVDKFRAFNFGQEITTGDDSGPYDFGSIMHYGATDFNKNGLPTIEAIPAGIPIGSRAGLTAADIATVRRIYDAADATTTIDTWPSGLTIIVDGRTFTAPSKFNWDAGARHTIAAGPTQQEGRVRHVFGRWSDDGEPSHTIVAGTSQVFIANYVRQYQMPLTVSGPGRLEVKPPPAGGGWFDVGSVIDISAIPNEGSSFYRWAGRGFFSTHGLSPNPLRLGITSTTLEYQAQFRTGSVTVITSNPPNRKIKVDSEAEEITTPQAFAWTPGSKHTIDVPNQTQSNSIQTIRYVFDRWTHGSDAQQEIVASSGALTANFRTLHQLQVNTPFGGTVQVNPSASDKYYEAGTPLTITPSPTGANKFAGWTDDIAGIDNPATLVIDDGKIVGARFGQPRVPASLVNAASFQFENAVAPGELVTLFGLEFGPEQLTMLQLNPTTGRAEMTLDNTRVLFDEFAAPLVYVSSGQIAAVVPYGIAGRTSVVVRIEYRGQAGPAVRIPAVQATPALFTLNSSGKGAAALLNQDNSANTPGNPATRGSVVTLYGTGEGVTSPTGVDGRLAANPLARPSLPVKVRIAGRDAEVLYFGGAPGLIAGIFQANVKIPDDCPAGNVPIVVQVGESSSPGNVTIAVR